MIDKAKYLLAGLLFMAGAVLIRLAQLVDPQVTSDALAECLTVVVTQAR